MYVLTSHLIFIHIFDINLFHIIQILQVLYQIYYTTNNGLQIKQFITYEHEKGMKYYWDLVDEHTSFVSISMLCNGEMVKEYGDKLLYNKCQKQAKYDYKYIKETVHLESLHKEDIVKKWNRKHDAEWLLSMDKEEIAALFTDLYNIPTAQIAIRLYDKLIQTLKYDVYDENDAQNKLKSDNIMFLWTKKNDDADITALDHIHFLYVVSLILDELKIKYKKVDIKKILFCLHEIEMNGLMFMKIARDTFKRSVVMHSQSFNQSIELEALQQLIECTETLYSEIQFFKLKSIRPSSICNISINTHDHTVNEEKSTNSVNVFQQHISEIFNVSLCL